MSATSTATLFELCKIRSGGTPLRSNSTFYNGVIPWAKISDLDTIDGKLTKTEECITDAGLRSIRGTIFEAGTLLFAIYGSIGKMAFAAHNVSTNQAILGINVRDPAKLTYRFLYHFLLFRNPQFQADGQGIAQKNLSAAYLRNLQIPLPTLNEQRRISAILDEADALCRKRKRAIELLDGLLFSQYYALFSSEEKFVELGNVLLSIDSGWSPNCSERAADIGEAGSLKLSAITQNLFRPGENKAFLHDILPREKDEIQQGDVLFCRKNTRELIGSSVYVWQTPPRLFISDLIFRLVPVREAIEPIFLQTAIASSEVRQAITLLSAGAAGSMPNISKAKLREIRIPFPDLQRQSQLVKIAKAVHNQRNFQVSALVAMNSHFASLQHRAFTGQL